MKRRPNGASSLPLAEQLELVKCVLVLGPCAGLLNGESLPVGTLLAHALGRELSARVPEPDDLPMVATAFQRQFEGGRLILEHTAANSLCSQTEPGELLRAVAQLPFPRRLNKVISALTKSQVPSRPIFESTSTRPVKSENHEASPAIRIRFRIHEISLLRCVAIPTCFSFEL